MSRTDDIARPPRPARSDNSDEVKEPQHGTPSRDDAAQVRTARPPPSKLLSREETIQLTKNAVENGLQETKRSLAGNEAVGDVVRPKLTIDLGHKNIGRVPDEVVDIIKDEVAR